MFIGGFAVSLENRQPIAPLPAEIMLTQPVWTAFAATFQTTWRSISSFISMQNVYLFYFNK